MFIVNQTRMSPKVKSIFTVIAINLVLLTYLIFNFASAIVTIIPGSMGVAVIGIVVYVLVLLMLEYGLYRIFYKIYS